MDRMEKLDRGAKSNYLSTITKLQCAKDKRERKGISSTSPKFSNIPKIPFDIWTKPLDHIPKIIYGSWLPIKNTSKNQNI